MTLKVFISHTFSERDQELSLKFNQYLEKNNINGYLAEQQPEYTILISDKIKNKITSSNYLIAIITDDGLASASVHEEIGFAMGKNIPIILMAEEKLKEKLKEKGVLTYGMESEYFTENSFESSSEKVINHIHDGPYNKKPQIENSVKEFLEKRNLHDEYSSNFISNPQTDRLQNTIKKEFIPNGEPRVLFSSCPSKLQSFDVHAKDFEEYLKKYRSIEIKDNHEIYFLDGDKEDDIEQINYVKKSSSNKIYNYFEFQNNGFIEQGFSGHLIAVRRGDDGSTRLLLHHCWLTGAFWAFVKFTKMYYEKMGMNEKFDIILSIRNSKDLMLFGFGGVAKSGHKWAEPNSHHWSGEKPETTRNNIQLKIESLETKDMDDRFIESKIRTISYDIACAYRLDSAMCYNHDESFNWDLMSWYNRYRI